MQAWGPGREWVWMVGTPGGAGWGHEHLPKRLGRVMGGSEGGAPTLKREQRNLGRSRACAQCSRRPPAHLRVPGGTSPPSRCGQPPGALSPACATSTVPSSAPQPCCSALSRVPGPCPCPQPCALCPQPCVLGLCPMSPAFCPVPPGPHPVSPAPCPTSPPFCAVSPALLHTSHVPPPLVPPSAGRSPIPIPPPPSPRPVPPPVPTAPPRSPRSPPVAQPSAPPAPAAAAAGGTRSGAGRTMSSLPAEREGGPADTGLPEEEVAGWGGDHPTGWGFGSGEGSAIAPHPRSPGAALRGRPRTLGGAAPDGGPVGVAGAGYPGLRRGERRAAQPPHLGTPAPAGPPRVPPACPRERPSAPPGKDTGRWGHETPGGARNSLTLGTVPGWHVG